MDVIHWIIQALLNCVNSFNLTIVTYNIHIRLEISGCNQDFDFKQNHSMIVKKGKIHEKFTMSEVWTDLDN